MAWPPHSAGSCGCVVRKRRSTGLRKAGLWLESWSAGKERFQNVKPRGGPPPPHTHTVDIILLSLLKRSKEPRDVGGSDDGDNSVQVEKMPLNEKKRLVLTRVHE